jgi:phenylacetate-CoA ligase
LLERLSKGYKASNSYINKTSGSSGTPIFCQRQILSCANLGVNIDLVGMELISSIFMFRWILSETKKRTSGFWSHRYRFPIFDLSDAILKEFQYKSLITLMVIPSIVLFAK